MSSRKDEILAKKARLAELKRQREERQQQNASSRQSLGGQASHSIAFLKHSTDDIAADSAWQVNGRKAIGN